MTVGGSSRRARHTLDLLIAALAKAGLSLNTQPPQHIVLSSGHQIQILPGSALHRWLGCMLAAPHNNMTMSPTTLLQHQNPSMQMAGFCVMARFPCRSNRNALMRWFRQSHVSRPDTERFTSLTCTGWMLSTKGCSVLWWDHLETFHGRNNKVRNACQENSLNNYIASLPRDRWVNSVLEWYLRRVSGGETT